MKKLLIALTLALISLSALAGSHKRLEIKEITENIYQAHQVFGLEKEGKPCGPYDILWCPKFNPSDDVYVTELRFTNSTHFILNLTSEESEALQNAAAARTNPAINLSACAKDGLPYSFTCKYQDIKFL